MIIALRLLRLAPLSLLGALGRLRLLGRLEGFSEFLVAEKPRGIRPRLLVFKRFGRKPPPPLLGRGLRVYLPPPDVDPVDPSAVARGARFRAARVRGEALVLGNRVDGFAEEAPPAAVGVKAAFDVGSVGWEGDIVRLIRGACLHLNRDLLVLESLTTSASSSCSSLTRGSSCSRPTLRWDSVRTSARIKMTSRLSAAGSPAKKESISWAWRSSRGVTRSGE